VLEGRGVVADIDKVLDGAAGALDGPAPFANFFIARWSFAYFSLALLFFVLL